MKNLFLTCMVLFLVFTFGCQESSITDPTQPLAEDQDPQVNNNDLIKVKPDDVNHNLISLKYQLADPFRGAAYDLSGQVKFENTLISSIDDDRQVWVKVRLEMSAQLSNSRESDHPPWKIEKKTEDKVPFTNSELSAEVKKLYKTYSITNRDDIVLCVTYFITLKNVKVAEVFLKPRGGYRATIVD